MKDTLFPAPVPAPEMKFGKIPPLVFPKTVINSDFTYTIDTLTGELPVFQDKVNVYPIIGSTPNFLNLQKAKTRISSLGFTRTGSSELVPEIALSDSVYEWHDESVLRRKITLDINSSNFRLTTDYASNAAVLSARLLADEEYAKNTAKGMLSSMGILPEDIDETRTLTELYRLESGSLVSATSLSNAQIIRVDLFQQALDKLPIYYPHPPHSTMNFLIASGSNDAEVIIANYFHQTVDVVSSTYPIKTANEAYAELQKGEGYVGSYFGSSSDINIKNVTLGYYLGDSLQSFVMPIIIFEGNDGFIAYVSAVRQDAIGIIGTQP